MNTLLEFNIPIKGLGQGLHEYSYAIGAAFFAAFEASPIKEGVVEVAVELDKRSTLIDVQFTFSGAIATTCDRCTAAIQLPIKGEHELVFKYSTEKTESDEDDVVYIHPETSKIDLSEYIYEFIVLATPLIKVYDCEEDEPAPCDFEMLSHLEIREPDNEEKEPNNPFKDALKDWNK